MAKGISINQIENSDQQEQQPVASRTRRLSSTLTVKNDCTATAAQEQGQTQSVEEPVKRHRHHHRHDYNELVNGQGHSNNGKIRLVARAYEMNESDRGEEEAQALIKYAHLLPLANVYLKRKREQQLLKQRLLEKEESPEIIRNKADNLVTMIRNSKHVIIYTGAGISTSASIPDYRGPNGLWTQIGRTGSFPMTRYFKDLSKAEPTYTHMAIRELCKRKIVKHVVSQNFDGLHLRSGLAPTQLSEIHGNMFIEICPTCERQYYRQADVTQKTVRFKHKTGRQCHNCPEPNNNLLDTIVLYGERSRSKWPMNWERASKAAKNADLIICMGTSLKTLRRYGCLWPKSITSTTSSTSSSSSSSSSTAAVRRHSTSARHETKLVIVNLQHTSKDKNAALKINGKCDLVMRHVMRQLNIDVPAYEISSDPLQRLAVPFNQNELARLERNLIFEISSSAPWQLSGGLEVQGSPPPLMEQELKVDARAKRKAGQNAALLSSPNGSHEQDDDESGCTQRRPPRMAAERSHKLETSTANVSDDRISPSLFVSELTNDPDKRRLRMRIRGLQDDPTLVGLNHF